MFFFCAEFVVVQLILLNKFVFSWLKIRLSTSAERCVAGAPGPPAGLGGVQGERECGFVSYGGTEPVADQFLFELFKMTLYYH